MIIEFCTALIEIKDVKASIVFRNGNLLIYSVCASGEGRVGTWALRVHSRNLRLNFLTESSIFCVYETFVNILYTLLAV